MTTLLLALCWGMLAAASPGPDGGLGGEAVALPEVEDEWSGLDEVLLLQLKHELTRQKVLSHSAVAAGLTATSAIAGARPAAAPAAAAAPSAGDLEALQNDEEFSGAMQVSFLQEQLDLINASAKEQQVSHKTQAGLEHEPQPVDNSSESQSAAQKDEAAEKTRQVSPQFVWPEWASIVQAAQGRVQTIAERMSHRSRRGAAKGATGAEVIGWVLLVGLAVAAWLCILAFFNWSSSQVPPEEIAEPALSEIRRRPTVRSFFPGGERRPRTNTGCC